MFSCHHASPNDHRCAGTDLASAERHPRSNGISGLEPEQGFPEDTGSPSAHLRTCAEGCSRRGPLLCFSAHYSRTPLLRARPASASARTLRGKKKAPKTQGRRHEGGGMRLGDGAHARRPDGPPAALTEVQELLHGERRWREARIEVHLARNAALRRRPGARGRVRGQATAGAGDGAERPDARAAPQQSCQPHTEPRRRSRSSRRQPAALRCCLGATCGTWRVAGAAGAAGGGELLSAPRPPPPSLEPRPRRRSPEDTEAGEKGALATAPCKRHARVGGAPGG